ncbi:uncharacterized protein LOC127159048 isoform X2 [Labeo rohita]|uniref:uncharacterized protein LOC127159048 isoform X2 n=1 Tax=Labeo rohita TaxID=84645 RepID=UPI0021E31300|nr:uncharacterized protein LOC127159048 isoform X2 [Labeo rohita]
MLDLRYVSSFHAALREPNDVHQNIARTTRQHRLDRLQETALLPLQPLLFVVLLHDGNLRYCMCAAGLNLEAADGENVTIHLETPELDRADRVTIALTRESEKKLIAQYCCCAQRGDCNVVETPGVSLQVQEGTLTLLDVSSRDSGFYEATIIVGNNVSKENATLNVNKPPFSSSRAPPQTSIPKPPNSSERHRFVLIAPVFIFVVLVLCFFCKCMKGRDPAAAVEEARETPAVSRLSIFKKMYRKRNCSDCAAVSFKACRGDPEDQLMDT